MPDPESQFLDALYLGVRDGTAFDDALDLLCSMFDVASATLIDFDAARSHVSAQATVGLFNPEAVRRYERDFAALDPAPPAFMKRPPGTAIPTYRLLPEETRRPGIFFSEFFRPLGLEECLGGTLASTNGRFAMIGLQRAPDRAAFDDDDIAKLAELQRDVASGGAGGLVRVPRPNGEPAYVVIVAPLFRGDGLDGGRRRGTLFVIHDPLHRGPTVPQLVAELFGLPLGSARLLAALAAGEELKDYAERAGISMNTVRFHPKTAYARTGAKRQSELVRLITAALRDLADHRLGNGR
jgi:DNA-binding CsgD family transcriptional regulator